MIQSPHRRPPRRYPPFWERVIPIILILIGLAILVLIGISLAVVLGGL